MKKETKSAINSLLNLIETDSRLSEEKENDLELKNLDSELNNIKNEQDYRKFSKHSRSNGGENTR